VHYLKLLAIQETRLCFIRNPVLVKLDKERTFRPPVVKSNKSVFCVWTHCQNPTLLPRVMHAYLP